VSGIWASFSHRKRSEVSSGFCVLPWRAFAAQIQSLPGISSKQKETIGKMVPDVPGINTHMQRVVAADILREPFVDRELTE
jgi:hypothetical protein